MVIHEIYHFLDRYTSEGFKEKTQNNLDYIDTKKFVKNQVAILLNEFDAERKSYKTLIDVIKRNQNLEDFAISRLENVVNDLIRKLKTVKDNDDKNFEVRISVIQIFIDYFFKYIFYFLGGQKAYLDHSITMQSFQEKWDDFIKEYEYLLENFGKFIAELPFQEGLRFLHYFHLTEMDLDQIRITLFNFIIAFLEHLKSDLSRDFKYNENVTLKYFFLNFYKFFTDFKFLALIFLATKGFF